MEETILLTQRHLDILLAALKFFDEEMSPHGREVARFYFENPAAGELRPREIKDLREDLRACTLRYVWCAPTSTQLISSELLTDLGVMSTSNAVSQNRIATILLPKSI